MLRVAYLFERFPSFSQTFCYREVRELQRQGAEVSVFSIRTPAGEPTQNWDDSLLASVHYLPAEKELVAQIDRAIRSREIPAEAAGMITSWGRNSDFLRLYQAAYLGLRLRAAGVERIHAHFAGMAARTAYWIRQFFGIPYSLTAHANDIFAPRDFIVSLAKIFEAATTIVTVSDYAVERLREQFPESASKLRRVYNGVDLAAFPPSEAKTEPPLLVGVGRLIEKKGFVDLIDACAVLKAEGRNFRCEIIGEGPLEAALSEQIRQAQLTDVVRLAGPQSQPEIAARLGAATVFVLPCVAEQQGGMDNLPTVIMEAMAAGLPVVSTPIAGVPEMVAAGTSGDLVPPHDPVALARAIDALLRDRARAREIGAAGQRIAREKFSIEANVRQLAGLLAERS